MYRILTGILVLALIGITGCAQQKKANEPQQVKLGDIAPEGTTAGVGDDARQPGDEAMGGKLDAQTVETVTPDEPAAFPQAKAVRKHRVIAGDTLSQLARKYYGNSRYWRKIWIANQDVIANPNDIKPGLELIIP